MIKRVMQLCATLMVFTLGHGANAAEAITPASNDHKEDARFVWVTAITGHDKAGVETRLFHNWQGTLLSIDALTTASTLIAPDTGTPRGSYRDLRVHLGSQMLTVRNGVMQQEPLPKKFAGGVPLPGQFEVQDDSMLAASHDKAPSKERLALLR